MHFMTSALIKLLSIIIIFIVIVKSGVINDQTWPLLKIAICIRIFHKKKKCRSNFQKNYKCYDLAMFYKVEDLNSNHWIQTTYRFPGKWDVFKTFFLTKYSRIFYGGTERNFLYKTFNSSSVTILKLDSLLLLNKNKFIHNTQ